MNRYITYGIFAASMTLHGSAFALNYSEALTLFNQSTAGNTGSEAVSGQDDINTVVKNEILTAQGNVLQNDQGGGLSSRLTGQPTGLYGYIILNSDGSYVYTLDNDNASVQALGKQDTLQDLFIYEVEGSDGKKTTAKLTVTVIGNSSSVTEQVFIEDRFGEIEPNNTIFNSTTIASGKPVSGQLFVDSGGTSDEDWFKINIRKTNSILKFDMPNSDGLWNVSFVDQVGNSLAITDNTTQGSTGDTSALTSIPFHFEMTVGQPGNYSIVVKPGPNWVNTPYQFTATLSDPVNPIASSPINSRDVEIEQNNRTAQATPITSSQIMKGHLQTSADKDWYSIRSLGNEIIHLELCPKGTSCYFGNTSGAEPELSSKSWVLYVFDSERFSNAMETQTFGLTRFIKETGEIVSTAPSNHMYLALEQGFFNDALVGVIDPCYGNNNALDIGVGPGARTYFVAISTPLKRDGEGCNDGNVVLQKPGNKISVLDADGKPQSMDTVVEYISAFPFSDDQYSLTVARTGQNPITDGAVIPATYDAGVQMVHIPKVRIFDQFYTADLKYLPSDQGIQNPLQLLELVNFYPLNEPVTNVEVGYTTFNPDNNAVFVPKLILFDELYEADLQFVPAGKDGNQVNLLKLNRLNTITE